MQEPESAFLILSLILVVKGLICCFPSTSRNILVVSSGPMSATFFISDMALSLDESNTSD